jgi:uncharacterized protein YyaL (SSP411 family)
MAHRAEAVSLVRDGFVQRAEQLGLEADRVRLHARYVQGSIELRSGVPADGLVLLLEAVEELGAADPQLAVRMLAVAGEAGFQSGELASTVTIGALLAALPETGDVSQQLLLHLYRAVYPAATASALAALREALALADELLELFADPEGGFYQTGADAEKLVVRPKELLDNAVPAGSSVAAAVLLRLGRLVGNQRYEQAAVAALGVVQGLFARAPTAFGYALGAADFALSRVREVAIVGEPGAADTAALLAEVRRRYRPNQVVALAAPGDREAPAAVPLLADRPTLDGHATAYVCEHFACRQPVADPEALAQQLG